MIFIKNRISIMSILSFLLIMSCNNQNIDIATYKAGGVSLKELTNIVGRLGMAEKEHLRTQEECYRFVRKIALEKIILEKVNATQLNNNSEISDKLVEIADSIAFDILREKNVLSKVKVVRSDYKKYSTLYTVYQIVRRIDTLDDKRINDSKKRLEQLREKIKTLDDFKKYATEYSEDVTSAEGGFIGKIRPGIMDEEIDKYLENANVGKVSEVIETYAGVHLIWLDSKENIEIDELLSDRTLYDTIYADKVVELEGKWFKELLKTDGLEISQPGNGVLVKYKGNIITEDNLEAKITELRQGVFPYPTSQEKENLLNDMIVQLLVKYMIRSDSLRNSEEFKIRYTTKSDYYLINQYIEKNKTIPEITKEDMDSFYKDNISALFTFKLENQSTYVQPFGEVEKFIIQKLQSKNDAEARYELYRKLVEEYDLIIPNEMIAKFMKKIN